MKRGVADFSHGIDDEVVFKALRKSYLFGKLARGVSITEKRAIWDEIDELNGVKKIYVVKDNLNILIGIIIFSIMNFGLCLWIIARLGLM